MDKNTMTLAQALELLENCVAVKLNGEYVFIPQIDKDFEQFLYIEDFDLSFCAVNNETVKTMNNNTLIFTDDNNEEVEFLLLSPMNFNN